MYRKLTSLACFVLVFTLAGTIWAAPLAPNDASIKDSLCLWLRNPDFNYDPGASVWADLSGKGNDARATVAGYVGPTLSSGENPTVFAHPFSAVHFDPTVQDLLKATNLNGGQGLSNLTIFSVQKVVTAGNASQRAVGFGSYNDGGRADHFNMAFDVTVRKDNGQIAGKNQDLPLNAFAIYAARMDPQIINMWFNSTGTLSLAFTATGSSYTTSTDQFYVGDLRYPAVGDFDVAEVVVFNTALTDAQVEGISEWLQLYVGIAAKTAASGSNPLDGATDVPRDVTLSWKPVATAVRRDVYFESIFDDVNDASRANPLGVLASQGQIATTYDPPGRLDFGQTYYWRVDEVNAPPDSTIFKGDVWSFTVEPVAYPIDTNSITATASSSNSAGEGPENTINDSGLNADDLHSAANTDMWLSSITGSQPTWIQYEFDRAYKLHQMLVWNHNSSVEPVIGFGIKEAAIEYSADGANWATLGTTHEFARAPGAAGYAANTTIDLGGVAVKYTKITAQSNWGGFIPQYGLSEVRFFSIPVLAREPSPVSGATDVGVDATLSWRAGREAAKHDVYLSTDEQAVRNGTAPVVAVTSPSYASSLDLAGTYYWRIDEVNDVETPTTWQGDVWSLSTQEYLVVDDFESYNDIDAGQEGSNLVYGTWIDGFGTTTNGSTIGYFEAFQPSMEKTLVYDGKQSVPLFYNNTTASLSEVTANVADLQVGRDWAKHGIKGLTLQFRGDPDNVLQQMYVKINSAKVTYDGSAENVRLKGWQMWYIDLASLGMSLSNVTKLTIGFERIGTLGGQGMVLLDGIRLYSYDRQLITPVDPGTAGLQAQYQFEGNANDSSGKGRNGSGVGNPTFAAGKIGQAVSLNGSNYVEITGYKGVLGGGAFSIAAWVKSTSTGDATIVCWGASTAGQRVDFRLGGGMLRVEHGNGNLQGNTTVADDQWHHVTLTVAENASISYPAVKLYLDGNDDSQTTTDPDTFNIVASVDMNIGRRGTHNDRGFLGLIDDARIYDRALTQEEIAWLADRTLPFDKPF